MKNLIRAILLLACFTAPLAAQVTLGGHILVPSTSDSNDGASNVVYAGNATCIIATATGCTVSNGPYVGTLNVTGTLSSTQALVVVLSPGRKYFVTNGTGQNLTVGGATGTTVTVAAGTSQAVWSPDGANYVAQATGGGGSTGTPQAGTPTGAVNGSNTVFTLSSTPIANSILFQVNGLAASYTNSGTTVTLATAPRTGDTVYANWFTASSSNYTPYAQTPSGTVNGTNQTFTLAYTPITGSLLFQVNGLYIIPSISGATVTVTPAPHTGDVLYANYFH